MAAYLHVPLANLIREWRRRLEDLRRAMAEPLNRERWLSEIRARVLTFLVSRYGEHPEMRDQPVLPPRVSAPRSGPFCMVEPEDNPPRAIPHLRHMLRDIRRQNELARPRWRLW